MRMYRTGHDKREYICPNCKQPLTKIKRSTPVSTSIGMIFIFLILPGILLALAILLFSGKDIVSQIISGGIVLFVPALFIKWLKSRTNRIKYICPACGSSMDILVGNYHHQEDNNERFGE